MTHHPEPEISRPPARTTALARLGMACLFFIGIAWSAPARAVSPPSQEISGPTSNKNEPIHVTSDRMEAYNKKNLIVFIGNVSAVQGNMEIHSDRLEVYIKKKEKKPAGVQAAIGAKISQASAPKPPKKALDAGMGQGSVERLIAIGNVLINQDKAKYASGEHLDYSEVTGIAILTGNPRAWEANNQVIGTKIEMFLREGRTIVYGNRNRRVSVTLYPKNEKADTKAKPPAPNPYGR